MFAFIHIASHGLASAGCCGFGAGGECDSLNQVDEDLCVTTARNNEDIVVGVKVRITADVAANGKNEQEAFRRALSASREAGLPLMVHHTFSSIPNQGHTGFEGLTNPGSLRPGDILTHCFHGYPSSILDSITLQPYRDVVGARERGVYLDVGHGLGSFTWKVAEICAKLRIWPDTISTDLHTENYDGPVYDLVTVMSKMMHLGMPLYDVIKAVTLTPSRVIGRHDTLGALSVGRSADITILREERGEHDLEDCQGYTRNISTLLEPVAVWKDGKQFRIESRYTPFPNKEKATTLIPKRSELVIKV